jgi:DNA polymerase-1
MELRLLAHFSQDTALIRYFHEGEFDIFKQLAAQLFNASYENVSGDERTRAKMITYAIIYGMSPFTLAKILNVPPKDATRFVSKRFVLFALLSIRFTNSWRSSAACALTSRERNNKRSKPKK